MIESSMHPVVVAQSLALETAARLRKPESNTQPSFDTYVAGKMGERQLSITIARTFEDMAKVIAIRSATFIGEQDHPYFKQFDGNDFCSTHLIAYIGEEPAGCFRARYFPDFARLERLAVQRRFRTSRIAFKLVRAGFDLCRAKGYRRVTGISREELVPFWSSFGGKVEKHRSPMFAVGHDHYEMSIEFDRLDTAIHELSDPFVLIRPEGKWHDFGPMEVDNKNKVA